MLKNPLGCMPAALLCGGCSQAGLVVGTAPAELAIPNQIDEVFNHNTRSRYRPHLTGEWRNGEDMEAWSEQRPSRLNPRERQLWHQLNRLADSNRDGTTTADDAFHGAAVALLQTANVPLMDDTEDGSSGSGLCTTSFW